MFFIYIYNKLRISILNLKQIKFTISILNLKKINLQ